MHECRREGSVHSTAEYLADDEMETESATKLGEKNVIPGSGLDTAYKRRPQISRMRGERATPSIQSEISNKPFRKDSLHTLKLVWVQEQFTALLPYIHYLRERALHTLYHVDTKVPESIAIFPAVFTTIQDNGDPNGILELLEGGEPP